MSFTVFLGNLPAWVTADDIRGWLSAESLVADAIKVIRNPETQESKGFAFIEAPNTEEMNAIIRRFDRAPLEDRLLRANPAQPPKPKGQVRPGGPTPAYTGQPHAASQSAGATQHAGGDQRPPRRGRNKPTGGKKSGNGGPNSAFAEELAKAL
jgi:RNA recognition motif-containing protein